MGTTVKDRKKHNTPRRQLQDFTNALREPLRNWPPRNLPNLSPKAIQKINFVIREAERHFNEGLAGLPKSDPVSHDRQLELALFDWASNIYCGFLDEVSHALRQGSWSLDDFSTYAGLFISDVGQGAFLKFRALAASTENRVEWKAQVFAHSELVYAVLNSVRSRQKGIELTTSARAYLFGQSEPVNRSREIAEILRETASSEAGRLRTGTNRAETSPGHTDKTTQGMVSKSTNGTAGGRLERRKP